MWGSRGDKPVLGSTVNHWYPCYRYLALNELRRDITGSKINTEKIIKTTTAKKNKNKKKPSKQQQKKQNRMTGIVAAITAVGYHMCWL